MDDIDHDIPGVHPELIDNDDIFPRNCGKPWPSLLPP
jgi:hypothetical protein